MKNPVKFRIRLAPKADTSRAKYRAKPSVQQNQPQADFALFSAKNHPPH
ncbi:hypothetical protein [Spirosoma foliorum]|uniref:Uncharacterized protein n=1 Tax=Spirosoma foliorum TaxID=2710596 RepID=A0A7G5GP26_9BACT|nr:hypothetical protein [Spirosoma foliorum]QMW00618.1 hypothetical protein H3H32_21785 [Spirosoma foliorum]